MLDQIDSLDFQDLLDHVPNRIQLTSTLEESLASERGVMATTHYEGRRSARFRCFGNAFAKLVPFLMDLQEFETESFVIVRDLSKTGVGIISHQQLFPEQVVILYLEKFRLETKVARARKLGKNCYEIGLSIMGRIET